jgi:hypothetical protein
MSLKKFLDAGRMVMGSPFDKTVKPLGDMSTATQQRLKYADQNGNWTDRGHDRATTKDYQMLERSRIARSKATK